LPLEIADKVEVLAEAGNQCLDDINIAAAKGSKKADNWRNPQALAASIEL
jgi:hypothetical protein